ncbi:hypothetical protein L1987_36086 [Smallanthus sonchifolius]|uniref:Uncharacterized protein n=1 Tax=Smallanthus sonchifolius TaxID=185202 RepID=A0ACB9HEX5_9ASTR|nr:hypothetical protein L1987_36086 [Smallanthus sonchifolius]
MRNDNLLDWINELDWYEKISKSGNLRPSFIKGKFEGSLPGLETYPDIGQAAFGTTGHNFTSCVGYIILESDNLASLFPNAQLNLGGFILDAHYLFAVMITLAVLPTVWLRDMSVLSYISGLYGYCYSGHAVFPNIYTSMAKKSQYPMVLLASFGICGFLYASVAVVGYMMFGESTESQFTLNLPTNLVASNIAVWTTNGFNALYFGCSPIYPLLCPCDVTHWIFNDHANFDISLCLLFEHPKGEDNSLSGVTLCVDRRGWNRLISYWNLYIAIGNRSTVVMMMF